MPLGRAGGRRGWDRGAGRDMGVGGSDRAPAVAPPAGLDCDGCARVCAPAYQPALCLVAVCTSAVLEHWQPRSRERAPDPRGDAQGPRGTGAGSTSAIRGGSNRIKAAAVGRAGMAGQQKPLTAAARDAWNAAAATRVLAASVHRHTGWVSYGLAWTAKMEALELVVELAIPAGERAAAVAEAATCRRTMTGDEEAMLREAARAYGRATKWLERSARAFGRSARCDRAEAAEEERSARAYRRADLEERGRAASRRAAEARRSGTTSAAWAKRTADEVAMFRMVVDGLDAAGGLDEAWGLSRWMTMLAAKIDVVRQAHAEAASEAEQAAMAGQEALDSLLHATDTVEQEAALAAVASRAAAAGKKTAPDARGGMRAWMAAVISVRSALEAAGDFESLASNPGRRAGRRRRGRPAGGARQTS